MANAVGARVWRPSAPDRIEADLTSLWRDLAREGPISRAVMSNLVVYCRCPANRDVDLASPPEAVPIDSVASQHPARVILLHHDPGAADGQPLLGTHVGILIVGGPDARYGVEQIAIRSACSEAALPSIVRRLMLGDVPTAVWWTEDISGARPLVPLVTMGRLLVYDSRCWRDVAAAVRALTPLLNGSTPASALRASAGRPELADVNWRRLTPVRHALAHAIASREAAPEARWTSIRIRHRPGEAALAWLLAGWLEGATIAVDEDAHLGDDTLIASFDDDLQLRLGAHRVSVDDAHGPAPFSMAVQHEDEAQAIAAELRVLAHDAVFHDALGALARRFGAA